MTTRHPMGQAGPHWALLLRPRWLAWHAIVWVATVGMLFLGDWQLHRAESGNQLSWAYTFEWPLFAAFTVYFWIKSLRDELRAGGAPASAESEPGRAVSAAGSAELAAAVADARVTAAAPATAAVPMTSGSAAASADDAAAVQAAGRAAGDGRPDSWDATSWDAASWDATGQRDEAASGGAPVDITRATPADGEAYLARLMAEVQRSGRRRSGR